MEEEEGGTSEDNGGLEDPDLHLVDQTTIQTAIREIKRSFQRSRKIRVKLLLQVNKYFENLARALTQNGRLKPYLLKVIYELQDLILEVTHLCNSLSHPPTRIGDIYSTIYDMGAYMEAVIIAVYTRCQRSGQIFGELMKEFLTSLIKISCDNPESWLYSVLISPIVLHMMNAFSYPDHNDFRISWCYEIGDLMFPLAKAVFNCGDFSCQHYLVTLFSCWAKWASPERSLPVINSVFKYVEGSARKELLRYSDSPDASVRTFLNAFNLSLKGPQSVIPISCMYLFVCDQEIRPPEHQVQTNADFWVDFSIMSGRLHAFYSIPGQASLVSLSIRRDQIDSVCVNWVVNDGESQSQSQRDDTQGSTSTFMKDEMVLFFHIVLNVDFESVTSDILSLIGKKYRSIYLVFRNGKLVEKVMKDMGYSIHECGTRNCERPRALRRLLTTEHKLSYKESWCPESQVFGLDKSVSEANDSFVSRRSFRSEQDGQNETRNETLNESRNETLYEILNESRNETLNETLNETIVSKSSQRNTSMRSGISSSNKENESQKGFQQIMNDTFGHAGNASQKSDVSAFYVSVLDQSSPPKDADTSLNLSQNPSVSNNVEDYLASSGWKQSSSHPDGLASVIEGQNTSMFTMEEDSLPPSRLNQQSSEPDEATTYLDSQSTFISNAKDPFLPHDQHEETVGDLQNISISTNFEDPLPVGAREKYAHLFKHAPFHQSSQHDSISRLETDESQPAPLPEKVCVNSKCRKKTAITPTRGRSKLMQDRSSTPKSVSHPHQESKEQPVPRTPIQERICEDSKCEKKRVLTPSRTLQKLMQNRHSTPNPSAPLHGPQTPPISEIGSPQRNILNLTCITDIDTQSLSSDEETLHEISYIPTTQRNRSELITNAISRSFSRSPIIQQFPGKDSKPKDISFNSVQSDSNARIQALIQQSSEIHGKPSDQSRDSFQYNSDNDTMRSLSPDPIVQSSLGKHGKPKDQSFNSVQRDSNASIASIRSSQNPGTRRKSRGQSFESNQNDSDVGSMRSVSPGPTIQPSPGKRDHLSGQPIGSVQNDSDDESMRSLSPDPIIQSSRGKYSKLKDQSLAQNDSNTSIRSIAASPGMRGKSRGQSVQSDSDTGSMISVSPGPTIQPSLRKRDQARGQPMAFVQNDSDDDSMRSLSPVFGFSRTLVPITEKRIPETSSAKHSSTPIRSTRTKQVSTSGKFPCYSNALMDWTTKLTEKKRSAEYDPYDLWSCSEMDEFRDKLFPKTKTYAKKKKQSSKLKRLQIVRMKKPNQKRSTVGMRRDDFDNSDEFIFTEHHSPSHKEKRWASFFKTR